jgi:hypothetical protein
MITPVVFSFQCGKDALLGRVAAKTERHMAHAERRQGGGDVSAEVSVIPLEEALHERAKGGVACIVELSNPGYG